MSAAKTTTASQRALRLLAILPWVAAQHGPTIDEVCARFDIDREQLLADLTLASMVGIHPYTPDELVEVVVEDDRVWVHYALSFRRALRLTHEQGLALVAAGASLLAVPGADPSGPLARGLAKVAATLNIDPDADVDVDLGEASAATLEVLRRGIDSHRQVEIDYYAYGRDDRSMRVVDPYRVVANRGQWYLMGHCHRAGGERLFRIDRIAYATLLDSTFTPPAAAPEVDVYQARETDPRVTLELDPAAGWVVEQYPVESVETLDGGRLRVTMAISAVPWLERLLLRLGPSGRVVGQVGGDADLSGAGPAAARRVRARYRA